MSTFGAFLVGLVCGALLVIVFTAILSAIDFRGPRRP